MRNVFKIFHRDLRNIIKNPAALIIVIGLCFLPSLYAWINIKACWNPYSNTGNLPIAIANNDDGAVFNGKNINVGDDIVQELKKNKSVDWIFVDDWQGNYGLNEGKYYALIEIPANFSNDLTSLTTVTPKKPDVVYRSNEKLNAIASKITNVAKNNLADNIKSSFISTVNKETFKELNSVGGQLKTDKPQIIQLKDIMTEANNNIEDVKKYILEANSSSTSLQQYLNEVKTTLPKLTEQINSLEKTTEQSKALVLSTKQTITSTESDLDNDVNQMQATNKQIESLLTNLKNINNEGNNNTTNTSNNNSNNIGSANNTNNAGINNNPTDNINQLNNLNDSLLNTINTDIENLNAIDKTNPNNYISTLVDSLKTLNGQIATEKNNSSQLKTLFSNNSSKDSINSVIDQLSSLNDEISMTTVNVSNNFYSNTSQALNIMSNNLTANLDNIDSVLEFTKVIVPQLNALANYGISSSKLSIKQSNDLGNKLTNIQDKLNQLSSKLKDLNGESLDQMIKLMEMNPNEIANFISSPIDVKDIEVYGAGIFGVGLTPFYTVLAIWVGALLLSALLTVDCKDFENGKKLNLKQKYFGKILLFLMLSLIQATIVTLGDKYILGVIPENMWLMLGFALVSAITFTFIIFTLVSVLGNVGKAIAVIIMVFQIAGAGGIYPVQTLPKIFGILQPLWPFTYAINGFREAIAGPIWVNVYKNLIALAIFSSSFLFLAVLKKPFHRLTEFMEHKFKEAGL